MNAWLDRLLQPLLVGVLRRLPARTVGLAFEAYKASLAGPDPRYGEYALEANNPQSLRFLLDAYPALEAAFQTYPRLSTLRFLDVGPAYGAAAAFLVDLHRSHFLGPRLEVEVLDITAERQDFIAAHCPHIRFVLGTLRELPAEKVWDVALCSNALEHMDDPRAFVDELLPRVSGFLVILAPYQEQPPLSLDHRLSIDERLFQGLPVERFEVFRTPAWPMTAEGVDRQQCLVVIKGQSSL